MAAVSISEMNGASEVARTDLFEIAAVNAQSSSGYSSYKQALGDIVDAINGDFTFSDLDTTDKTIIGAINEIAAGGGGTVVTELTGELSAGETEITLTDSQIETDGTYDFYTSKYGVVPTNVEIAAGSITLTFDAQSENITVMVRKWDESGGSSSWNYSTTETDTGQKWIDGKEIYCKVFDFSDSPIALSSNNQRDFPNALAANERIVDGHVIYGSDTFKGMCPAFMTTDNQGTLGVNSFHSVNAYQIIVKYIKL